MFPAHSEPYVSSHLLAFRTSQVPVSSGKSSNDLGLPGAQCWGLVLKESLQTLPKSLRRAGTATHRSCRAGILEGHCKYCLNRSSKACPMEPMTSWASPSQHSRMWQAWREGDTHSLETVPELSGPLDKEPHLRYRGKMSHTSLLVCLYQPTVSPLWASYHGYGHTKFLEGLSAKVKVLFLILKTHLSFYVCVCVLPSCVSLHLTHAVPEEGRRFPCTGVTGGCKIPSGY